MQNLKNLCSKSRVSKHKIDLFTHVPDHTRPILSILHPSSPRFPSAASVCFGVFWFFSSSVSARFPRRDGQQVPWSLWNRWCFPGTLTSEFLTSPYQVKVNYRIFIYIYILHTFFGIVYIYIYIKQLEEALRVWHWVYVPTVPTVPHYVGEVGLQLQEVWYGMLR